MHKIKITCDSTCDLGPELYRRFDIEPIPLGIVLGDVLYYDGVDVTEDIIFEYVQQTGQLPKTTAVSIAEYTDVFKRWTDEGYSIIHISFSSCMSSCWQNASLAAQSFDNVFIFDSLNLSTGSGYLALEAADLAAEGWTPSTIVSRLEELRGCMNVSFLLQTLEFMRKGGRCSALTMGSATLLHIKPSLRMADGSLHVSRKYRGNVSKTIKDYVTDKLAEPDKVIRKRVFVTHTDVDREIIDDVIQLVRASNLFDEILETSAGCAISTHCGNNCIGLLFCEEGKSQSFQF